MPFLSSKLSKVSVELPLFLYFVANFLSNCLNTNLLLSKACDPISASSAGSICDNEKEAQHVVASINVWRMLIQQLVPIIMAMIAGTWSDLHGRRRRPLIVLPIIGQIAADTISLYCAVEWSVSPAITALLQVVMLSFSGGQPMLCNGINSYVGDTTSEKWRTVKYGVLNGVMIGGCIVGMFVYGYVIVSVGFVFAYTMCICLGVAAIVLTFVFVHDIGEAADEKTSVHKISLYQDIVRTINPVETLRTCFRVLTKRRQNHNTTILNLAVLACAPLTSITIDGEFSIIYLFLRCKFQFKDVDFSIINAYQMVVLFVGNIFALGVLSHKFRMNDALIGIIASIFDLLAVIAFLFVSQKWLLYFVPPLELFRGASLALTSSIASKCVEPTELGAMNSVKLLAESIMKTGFLPLYSIVYNNTLESNPSAFYVISIILTVPLFFIFWLINYLNRGLLSCSIDDGENKHCDNKTINVLDPTVHDETNCHI